MSTQLSTVESLKPLFPGESSGDFSTAIARANDNMLRVLASAVNYGEAGRPETEIHENFVSYVIGLALFHRTLDVPSGLGSNIPQFRIALNKYIDDIFNKTATVTNSELSQILLGSRADEQITVCSLTPAPAPKGTASLRNLGNAGNTSMYNMITLSLLRRVLFAGNPANTKDARVKNWADDLVDECIVNPNVLSSSPFCMAGIYNDLESKLNLPSGALKQADFLPIMKQIFTNHGLRVLDNLNVTNVAGNLCLPENTSVANILNEVELKKNISDACYDAMNKLAQTSVSLQRYFETTRGRGVGLPRLAHAVSEDVNTVVQKVFGNWQNLSTDAQLFLRDTVHLFRKLGKTASTADPNESGWEDITPTNKDWSFTYDPNQLYRINFMKATPGSPDYAFAQRLPQMPSSRTISFMDATGNKYTVNVIDKDVLRHIYNLVFRGDEQGLAGIFGITNLAQVKWTWPAQLQRMNLNIRYDKFTILYFKEVDNKNPPNGPNSNSNSPNCNDPLNIYEDLTTNMLFFRKKDSNGNDKLFLIKDINHPEKAEEYIQSEHVLDAKCLGSGLLPADDDAGGKKCSQFVHECLMNGNTNDLANCLQQLEKVDMFKHIVNEFRADPKLAKRILITFGFRRHRVNGYWYPESYDNWANNVLVNMKDSVKNAIYKNPMLQKYLSTLVSFVSQNLVVLNDGEIDFTRVKENDMDADEETQYKKILGKVGWWRYPYGENASTTQYVTAMMASPIFMQPNVVPTPSPLLNVAYGNTPAVFLPIMAGGSYSNEESVLLKNIDKYNTTSTHLRVLMRDVQNDLKNKGITVRDSDMGRIKQSIDNMEKSEKKLFELWRLLKVVSELVSYFRATGCSPTIGMGAEVSLENLRSKKDILAYLENNLHGIQSCISSGTISQNNACSGVMQQFTALLDLGNGAQNDNIVPIPL